RGVARGRRRQPGRGPRPRASDGDGALQPDGPRRAEPRPRSVAELGRHAGIHPLVLAFIRARPDRLFELPPTDATHAYPTPRAWHMLSDTLASDTERLW